MAQQDIRRYSARSASTPTFGRVLCSVRNHHYVIDGPEQNGCPGDEVTPAELFLSAVSACGVELVQVLARSEKIPLEAVEVDIQAWMDRSNPVRPEVSLFQSVSLQFHMKGVTEGQAGHLVEKFKGR